MALINTLRKRMGNIVVGVVAFSMLAFIGTDLFQSNSSLFGGQDRTVAEIAGTEVSYDAFNQQVDRLATTFALNYGKNPTSDEITNIRTEAWNALILEHAYSKEFEKLGIEVTDAELVDMVQGNNISPQIRQFFTDPNTGQFSKETIVGFLRSLSQQDPRQRQSWYSFEATLAPTRRVQKYSNLFEKTNYVTEAEAKSHYVSQNSSMTVDYAYVPYFAVPDSMFEVSISEMEKYLSANASKYQKEEARNINYVVFPIEPSADDSAFVKDEVAALKQGLANAQNDSAFAMINSDDANAYQSITDPSLIPIGLTVDGKPGEIGTVTDPQLVGSTYVISKLSDITEGDEYFVKASHILIKPEGDSPSDKTAALNKAKNLISQLRSGADFAALALENSEDRSNSASGGDLGWFGENGNFVQEFKDAAFGKKGTGLIKQPVETSFGYHIIRIDEPKTNKVYKVAQIKKELFASDVTLNEIYRQADVIAAESGSAIELAEKAKELGINVRSAVGLKKNDSRVGNLANARSIVSWAYNKASASNPISEVFELDRNYVVAGLTSIQEAGTAKLERVEGEIKVKVLNQKKADYLVEKLKKIKEEDVDAIKEAYGEGARSGSADLTLSSNSFPGVGFSPEAIGVAFSLDEGERTQPFATENGVIIMVATAKSTPDDLDSYQAYKAQVQSKNAGRRTVVSNFPLSFFPVFIPEGIDNTIKEFANIEDKRYKFY